MRDSSYNSYTQTKQILSRGGEKKVMKKSLSLLLTFALVFGLFANMASAAETPASAGKYLFDNKIIQGNGTDLLVNDTWKRQDLAVLLSRLMGVEAEAKATAKSHTYKDVRGTFYDGYLSWAKEKGYMEGASATSFGFDQLLNNQSFAAVVLRALGVDTTGDKYKDVPELAVKAGIATAETDWSAPAKRGETYVAIYTALGTVVEGTGKTLGEILNLPGFEVKELAVAKISQTGAKKITVEFKGAISADEEKALKAEVKNGLVPYPVTIKVAEDKKSAVLEAVFLPAGEYDVKINDFDAVKVTVVAGVVTKIDIGASALQATYDQDLKVKALNQFNEEVKNEAINVQAFSSQNGDLVAASKLNGNVLNLSGEKVDNTVVITATHYQTGLSASKTYKLVAGSSATSIQLGQVSPLKDKTRITAGESGLILPVVLKDQYGDVIKLPKRTATNTDETSVVIGGINFVVSDKSLVDATSLAVDADGVVTFKALAAGTVVFTVVNPATGANASVSVKIEAASALKTLQVSVPAAIVVVGEDVVFPYVAADTFGEPIAAKDVPGKVTGLVNNSTGFIIQANGLTVPHKWKANGDLQLTFPTKGNQNVIVWHKGAIASQFNVLVNDVAYPVSISGTKDLKTTLTVGATQALNNSKLNIVDNYGRTSSKVASGWTLTFTEESGNANTSFDGTDVTAGAVGSEKITAKLTKAGATTVSYEITFNVIKDADVKTVEVSAIGTVYAGLPLTHTATLTLTGKTEAGVEVAVVQTTGRFFDLVTSSNDNIVTPVSPTGLVVKGVAKGEATISVWKAGSKLNDQTVTVSDVAPYATSVKFTAAEGSTDSTATPTPVLTFDAGDKLEVKDQYGKPVANAKTTGFWYTSDAAIATVNGSGVVTKVGSGQVTITYVSNNGISATIIVNIE